MQHPDPAHRQVHWRRTDVHPHELFGRESQFQQLSQQQAVARTDIHDPREEILATGGGAAAFEDHLGHVVTDADRRAEVLLGAVAA